MTLDPRLIRNAFGRFATGVTVVTCAKDDGIPHGATVNAFTADSSRTARPRPPPRRPGPRRPPGR